MYIVDFERETEIGVGPSWPFGELSGDECTITEDLAETLLLEKKNNNTVLLYAEHCHLWKSTA